MVRVGMERADGVVDRGQGLGRGARRTGGGSPRTEDEHAISAATSHDARESGSSEGGTGRGMEQSTAGLSRRSGLAFAPLRLFARQQSSGGGGERTGVYSAHRSGE